VSVDSSEVAATLYVYYRINPTRREELRIAVEGLFAAIHRETGILGCWMQRRDDPETCMEIYAPVGAVAEFVAVLEAQVRRLDMERLLAAGASRRTETFIPAH